MMMHILSFETAWNSSEIIKVIDVVLLFWYPPIEREKNKIKNREFKDNIDYKRNRNRWWKLWFLLFWWYISNHIIALLVNLNFGLLITWFSTILNLYIKCTVVYKIPFGPHCVHPCTQSTNNQVKSCN